MDIEDILNSQSKTHHYIPQFYSSGFKNKDGLLYIYNKKQNIILSKAKSPKSVFFEVKRNTIEVVENIESSIIEDIYSKIDNDANKIIKYYQQEQLNKIDFIPQDTANFQFFLTTLFWRIPYTDSATKDIMMRSEIKSEGIDPEVFRNDPTFQKLNRVGLFKNVIGEIANLKGPININIHQSLEDFYVLGDNPVLYRKTPTTFKELGELDFLVAVNPRRIYSSTKNLLTEFKSINSVRYNIAVIHQSVNYVASNNHDVLKNAITKYNELKEKGLLYKINEHAFENE